MSDWARGSAKCTETGVCERSWDALVPVRDVANVRHCHRCDCRVFHCDSEQQFAKAQAAGHELPVAGPYADRLLANRVAQAMAATDLIDDSAPRDRDSGQEAAIAWMVPPAEMLEEQRRSAVEGGLTREEAEQLYPADPFYFMMQACMDRSELERLRVCFMRFDVDKSYIDLIDEMLTT